jgi:hypothetical protein
LASLLAIERRNGCGRVVTIWPDQQVTPSAAEHDQTHPVAVQVGHLVGAADARQGGDGELAGARPVSSHGLSSFVLVVAVPRRQAW